jgi:hypothetical protein
MPAAGPVFCRLHGLRLNRVLQLEARPAPFHAAQAFYPFEPFFFAVQALRLQALQQRQQPLDVGPFAAAVEKARGGWFVPALRC